jgi:predicted NBD/HSP70 family sugar kinase
MRDIATDGSRSVAIQAMGKILSLITSGNAQTRLELTDVTGWSRSTVAEHLQSLLKGGFVHERIEAQAGRGRPTRLLGLNHGFAVVLVADVGEKHTHLAVTDLGLNILAEMRDSLDIHHGPEPALTWMITQFERLLSSIDRSIKDVMGIGLGLPAQIDFETARVVAPSVMTGWADFDIQAWMRRRMDVPVLVENEVNLMAISEHHRYWKDIKHLFFVKAGTGVGSGIIAGGKIYRGARGAAGEIGHIQVDSVDGPLCRCGKLGCLEARASGWALARDLRTFGIPAEGARDIIDLIKNNRPEAIQRVREAGRILGKVIADIGCVLNPAAIIVGGTLSRTEDYLMAGLRELLYQRSLPLMTRELIVETAKADLDTCVILGAAQMVITEQLADERSTETVRRFSPYFD